MNVSPPNSQIVANTNVGDNHMAAVIVRQKEWWTTHPTGQDDVLTIGTRDASLGDQPTVDVLSKVTSNGIIGIHVHDAAESPGDSTLDLLPFFPTQAFQTGVDVFMPAGEPPAGTVSFVNAPRADTSRLQAINVPNWPSTTDRVTVTFNDFVQDINTWGACKRAKPSPSRRSRPRRGGVKPGARPSHSSGGSDPHLRHAACDEHRVGERQIGAGHSAHSHDLDQEARPSNGARPASRQTDAGAEDSAFDAVSRFAATAQTARTSVSRSMA